MSAVDRSAAAPPTVMGRVFAGNPRLLLAGGAGKGATATPTIRIKMTSGKLVKTLKGTTSSGKVVLTGNFDCALPKGQYRAGAQVSGIACT